MNSEMAYLVLENRFDFADQSLFLDPFSSDILKTYIDDWISYLIVRFLR